LKTASRINHCRRCREPISAAQILGRKRRYCSDACRQAAYRGRSCRLVHFSSQTDEWSTPPEFFNQLNAEFSFNLDACATPENAKCERFFTRADDGLAQRWTGRVWCNPPYDREIGHWMQKALESAGAGDCELAVCVVPARTDTAWWHETATHG